MSGLTVDQIVNQVGTHLKHLLTELSNGHALSCDEAIATVTDHGAEYPRGHHLEFKVDLYLHLELNVDSDNPPSDGQ